MLPNTLSLPLVHPERKFTVTLSVFPLVVTVVPIPLMFAAPVMLHVKLSAPGCVVIV